MIKSDLESDSKFKRICNKYDIYYKNFEIYGDLILLNNPGSELFVLLDKNYNTIAIENAMVKDYASFVKILYNEYCEYGTSKCFDYNLGFPFDKCSLKQVVEVANRIAVASDDDDIKMLVNGTYCTYRQKDDYLQLLSYIKFLGKVINDYQLYVHINKKMGICAMDINLYIAKLIGRINDFIDINIKNKKVPELDNMLNYLAYDEIEYEDYRLFIKEIICLLLRHKGFKVVDDMLEKIPVSNACSLSDKAVQLLELLNMSDFEFKKRMKNINDREEDLFSIISLSDKQFIPRKILTLNKDRIGK